MTRINVIDPRHLTDQHLMAEYRELPRIFGAARKLSPKERVPSYRLGKGHVLFFYDKLGWLAQRHGQIVEELHRRGYQLSFTRPITPTGPLAGDWAPDAQATKANLSRLRERLQAKPSYYKLYGKPVDPDFYG